MERRLAKDSFAPATGQGAPASRMASDESWWMLRPSMVTPSDSGFSREPPHSGQGMKRNGNTSMPRCLASSTITSAAPLVAAALTRLPGTAADFLVRSFSVRLAMALTPYQQLEQEFRRLHAFRSAASLLRWDSAVMMPRGSSELRGEQLAALETEAHSLVTSPRVSRLLDRAPT